MPELEEFLSQFRVQFAQQHSADTLERYLTGLMTEHPNKNCDTMAAVVPGTNEQQLNNLLTGMCWEQDKLNEDRVKVMLGLGSEGDGVLIFDDTGFAKQGKSSVGVARQYSGTLGKVGNCQVAVNCHYAERTIGWPVATRLYLPREWAADMERRAKVKVPEEIEFQTKAEIALDLLDFANRCGVGHKCVVADADYGDNPNFLDGLEERREHYCAAVRANFSVAKSRSGEVERADDLLLGLPLRKWQTINWIEGSKGTLSAKFIALRCYRVDGQGKRRVGWLIGQRPGRGQEGEWKYHWSNFSPKTPLSVIVEYAHRRHWVEQYHEEAKGELGWDQYQGRLWHGFHRHAVTVMLSYSFLVWLEWRARQQERSRGRPRGPFSPSKGSKKDFSTSGTSLRYRVAPL
jgi:SRSO17 transposase